MDAAMPTIQATPLAASAFLERLLRVLIPYFADVTADLDAARAEALETLVSYGARTRAELLCAVQIIVFGFTALDTLVESSAPDLSPSMRLRLRGCANNLSRSGQKTEQTLAKRLACDAPSPTDPQADPINDLSEPQIEEILQYTQAEIEKCRNHRPANSPTQGPQPRPTNQAAQAKPSWGAVMMDSLAAELRMPIKPPSGI
jgi:hypothetical protein